MAVGLLCTIRNCNKCHYLVTVNSSAPVCERLLQSSCCDNYIHDTLSLWPVKQNAVDPESEVLDRFNYEPVALAAIFIAAFIVLLICYNRCDETRL